MNNREADLVEVKSVDEGDSQAETNKMAGPFIFVSCIIMYYFFLAAIIILVDGLSGTLTTWLLALPALPVLIGILVLWAKYQNAKNSEAMAGEDELVDIEGFPVDDFDMGSEDDISSDDLQEFEQQ